jgi:hypothetical protein
VNQYDAYESECELLARLNDIDGKLTTILSTLRRGPEPQPRPRQQTLEAMVAELFGEIHPQPN